MSGVFIYLFMAYFMTKNSRNATFGTVITRTDYARPGGKMKGNYLYCRPDGEWNGVVIVTQRVI